MRLLSIDTVSKQISVSLICGGVVVDTIEHIKEHEHARHIVIFIELILSRNQIWYSDLDAICVTTGPGSFTGIRIGLSAAIAVECIIQDIKLIGVSNFDAYQALHLSDSARKMIVLSASKNSFIIKYCDGESLHLDKKALDSRLAIYDYDILMGDCPEFLLKYPNYTKMSQAISSSSGLIGYKMLLEGNDKYPTPQYIGWSVKKY